MYVKHLVQHLAHSRQSIISCTCSRGNLKLFKEQQNPSNVKFITFTIWKRAVRRRRASTRPRCRRRRRPQNTLHLPQLGLCPFSSGSLALPPPQSDHQPPPCSSELDYSTHLLRINSYSIFPFVLAYFTEHNVLKACPGFSRCQNSRLFPG